MKKRIIYIILCLISSVIPAIDVYHKIAYSRSWRTSIENTGGTNPMLPTFNSFSLWMCGIQPDRSATIYYYILLICVLALCFIMTQKGDKKREGLRAFPKIFGLSGLLAVIPLLFNFVAVSMFVSSVRPDSAYDIFYGIFSDNAFGDLFYTQPLLYLLLFMLIVFVFWGMIGCIGYGLALTCRYRIIPLLVICGTALMISYLQHRYSSEQQFSPLSLFSSYTCLYDHNKLLIVESVLLMVILGIVLLDSVKYVKKQAKA